MAAAQRIRDRLARGQLLDRDVELGDARSPGASHDDEERRRAQNDFAPPAAQDGQAERTRPSSRLPHGIGDLENGAVDTADLAGLHEKSSRPAAQRWARPSKTSSAQDR